MTTVLQNGVVDVSNTEAYEKYVENLFTSGKLIKLHIGMWGMSAQLERKDLQVPENVELPDLFKLGRKRLVKDDIYNGFKFIESRARRYLERNSFNFLAADAHFVPLNKVPDVLADLYEYQAQFNAKADDFVQNYEAYKEQTLKEYEKFRSSLLPYYPDVNTLRPRFYFEVSMFQISLPEKVEGVDLQSVLIERNVATEKRAQIEAEMEKHLARQKAEMGQKIYGFVGECVTALRENVYKTSKLIAEKLAKNEPVNSKNLTSLRNLVNQFESLNFFNDSEVGAALNQLNGLITKDHDFKENKAALAALQTSLTTVMDAAQKATDVPQLNGEFFRKFD